MSAGFGGLGFCFMSSGFKCASKSEKKTEKMLKL